MSNYDKLKPEFKKQWLEALRSGKYRQACGLLRTAPDTGNCHCCLGVAADLLNPNGWLGISSFFFQVPEQSSAIRLPEDARISINLDSHAMEKLQILNDKDLLDFREIADWIEENL